MSDRKLLELAAKIATASGMKLHKYHNDDDPDEYVEWRIEAIAGDGSTWHKLWNPRTNEDDSQRLAVKLYLVVAVMRATHAKPAFTAVYHFNGPEHVSEEHGDDPNAATRLAILRCAAAIGEAMP